MRALPYIGTQILVLLSPSWDAVPADSDVFLRETPRALHMYACMHVCVHTECVHKHLRIMLAEAISCFHCLLHKQKTTQHTHPHTHKFMGVHTPTFTDIFRAGIYSTHFSASLLLRPLVAFHSLLLLRRTTSLFLCRRWNRYCHVCTCVYVSMYVCICMYWSVLFLLRRMTSVFLCKREMMHTHAHKIYLRHSLVSRSSQKQDRDSE